MRTYLELISLPTLKERFNYLKIGGEIGFQTFGGRRLLNQRFYSSREWKDFRHKIILRDNGNELGLNDYPINGSIYIHHIQPITETDLLERTSAILDENNVISCSFLMHNAIHFGDEKLLPFETLDRKPNDTIPWR